MRLSVQAVASGADEELAAASAGGDTSAFRMLAERYSRPAFNYAYHLLGGYDEASDAVQETLIQVYQSLPKARLDLPFHPWFYHILRNKCLDSLRRRKSITHFSSMDADEEEGNQSLNGRLVDADPLPDELFERRDLQQLLHESIRTLPPKYREVVVLRYTTELTFEEMGIALNIPVNTVKTHFQRAKGMLRTALLAKGGGL